MKKYIVTWKTIDNESTVSIFEDYMILEFEDISFKNMYIRATDDDTGKTYYIPYTSIYDIKYVKDEDGQSDI
jgi:hypothetical protein